MRLHLPILLPPPQPGAPQLGLRVAGELLLWREGECLCFDDSFEHSVDFALPSGTAELPPQCTLAQLRVVLVVDLRHPQASRWFPESGRQRPRRGSS